MTLFIDEPLFVPPWYQIEGLEEQDIIESFGIASYLHLEVISDFLEPGDEKIAINKYNITQFTS